MPTKKCKKCGWEFPATYPKRTCKFCGGPLQGGFCSGCGEWSEKVGYSHRYCTACATEAYKRWKGKHIANDEANYKDWLDKINRIPQPYKTLTEAEWLEACNHFGGCAYCGSPEIAARSMFIQFKEGGRYCAWNIIPACEKCETAIKKLTNPFSRMNEAVLSHKENATKKYGYNRETLQKIVDYLERKMQ